MQIYTFTIEDEKEARIFGVALRQRMGKFGLTISEEKSKIIEFGRCACHRARKYGFKCETFDFLGFTHFCDKTRRGKFKLGRKTSRKKFIQKMKDMNLWLKHIRNRDELKEWWKLSGIKLLGHYQYYGMSGNARWLRNFYDISFTLQPEHIEDVLLKSRMREILTSGSVRGLMATLGLLPQQMVGYELYSTDEQ